MNLWWQRFKKKLNIFKKGNCMNFVKFTKPPKKPFICSVSNTGKINLNTGIKREFSLDKYKFAVLYHDLENKLFCIEFLCDEDALKEQHLHKMTHHVSGTSINAKTFLEFLGICKEKTTRFPVKKDGNNRIIVDFSHAETI
jgi:hypothetical protein